MDSNIIGEPFQLYLGSTHCRKDVNKKHSQAVYPTHNPNFPGHATATAQADGIHVWDLRNLHAVASYSVGQNVVFANPAISFCVSEEGTKSVITYVAMFSAPDIASGDRGRTIWIIRQSLSGSKPATKAAVVVQIPPVRILGTGHDVTPLLLVSKSGSLSIADAQVDIKRQLEWPGGRHHMETFVFPRESCSFIQHDADLYSSVAIICCRDGKVLQVRVALLGDEIIPAGTCETPIASATLGITCSPSGVLSVVDSRGVWLAYQLMSLNSSLTLISISEKLCLQRFAILRNKDFQPENGFSVISLGTSLVLLAAFVEGTQEISVQIWDLSYGILLTAQSMSVPSALLLAHLSLTVADEGQVLLTMSTSQPQDKKDSLGHSSIYIVPVDTQLKSNLNAVLGKTSLTTEWLIPQSQQQTKVDQDSAKIISKVQKALANNKALNAEQAFLEWVDSRSSKEEALGHEFVKKMFNIILPLDPPKNHPYAPRITRCILENAVVSNIMLDGRLITALRQRGDWENVMLVLTTVVDISEDELMASAKVLVDRQRRNETTMDVGASEGYAPPLWSYLFACVSYPFSAAPMRLAIRKYLPDAQDLVLILEILGNWIQGGDEHEMEALLKSLATSTKMSSSRADSPPYPKVIAFLQALLDASLVALLQYQPSHELLRRMLSYIEPEITFIDGLEPLRGVLEPFVKAHGLKEKIATSKESPAEWRKRSKQLREQAGLSIGLYRLEELVI